MLKIVNQYGRILELDPKQVISVDKFNPLFNDPSKLFQDISYPGTAPFSESNKLFFGMAHLVEAPNADYNIPAQFFCDEIQLAAGLINFRIGSDPTGFEFNLEPNLTAVNSLLQTARMPEILTDDADYTMTGNYAAFEARMLDSAQNPDKYPYIFFPVANTAFSSNPAKAYPFINFWNAVDQKFMAAPVTDTFIGVSPYWKLTYIIKQVASYLGFTVAGSFFTNPETKNLCIYTRYADGSADILPCMRYMPNILVTDFLKQIRERLHVAFDFDLRNQVLTVETFKSIKNSNELIDLSKWITTTIEQEVPTQQAYTVTLKSDQQDAAFIVTDVNGKNTYPALFTLVAGAGDTALELDCSTTKGVDLSLPGFPEAKYPLVNQSAFNAGAWITSGGISLPPDMNYTDITDSTTLNNWPLRLINYLGCQPVSSGGVSPNAEPYDLNDDDIDFYRFSNDSKRLIITAYMPASVLAGLNVTKKFTHRTAGLNFTKYILEQVSYDSPIDGDLIPVKLYARTLDYQATTKVTITPLTTGTTTTSTSTVTVPQFSTGYIKAYFDPLLHGINQVNIQLVVTDPGVHQPDPITVSTTPKGTGGVSVPIIVDLSGAGGSPAGSATDIRVLQGQPKYYISAGIKTYFTKVANYYTAPIVITTFPTAQISETMIIFF